MKKIIPDVSPELPRIGNAFTRFLGRSFLRLAGWRVDGEVPNIKRYVMAGAPHTSNWDFVYVMAAILALGVKIHWLGKHTIFSWPFRSLFIALGGIPVNRQEAQDVVSEAIKSFNSSATRIIAIAPEGTRGKVTRWKTGFIRIAHQAQVPIVNCLLDYKTKSIIIKKPFFTTGEIEKDLADIQQDFSEAKGKRPALQ